MVKFLYNSFRKASEQKITDFESYVVGMFEATCEPPGVFRFEERRPSTACGFLANQTVASK
jgi:hypothetical protein